MRTLEELKEYYDKNIVNELKELDAKRKRVMVKVLLLHVMFLGTAAFLILGFLIVAATQTPEYGMTCCCLGMIPMVVFAAIWPWGYKKVTRDYVSEYKGSVVQKIVGFAGEGLTLDPKGCVPSSIFVKGRMFTQSPDRYHGEDLVSGIIGKTRIQFSEVHAEYRTEWTDKEGHRHESWHTIFRGLFVVADFNKSFKGLTVVLPDTAEKMWGSMIGSALQKMNVFRGKLIKMEDPEFERLFVVYGEDDVEARYILSTSLMQRIVEYKKKTRRDIHISFVENNVMVAIPYAKDLFEPKIFRSIVDYKQIQEYFEAIQLATSIVDELNLNTRIWSKE